MAGGHCAFGAALNRASGRRGPSLRFSELGGSAPSGARRRAIP